MTSMRRGWLGSLIAIVLSLGVFSGAARGLDVPLLNWAQYTPTFTAGYDPTSANDCKAGKIQCVNAVIREMTRRFDAQAAACDHDSMFALAYLRTTEEYKRAATGVSPYPSPSLFSDPGFVNHEDAVFARYYFEAYDAWHSGNVLGTPPAWRVALEAADQGAVSADGNVLLGISAHINRDLPFVLAEIGLIKPDGTSRKPDHDLVNEFLNRVSFYGEAAAKFDPSMDDSGEYLGSGTAIHSVMAWREQAWRNAERLANATTAADRALVAQSIEDFAHAEALALKAANPVKDDFDNAARLAYCQAAQA